MPGSHEQPFPSAFAVPPEGKQAPTGISAHSGHLRCTPTNPFCQDLSLWKIQNTQVTPGCVFFFFCNYEQMSWSETFRQHKQALFPNLF